MPASLLSSCLRQRAVSRFATANYQLHNSPQTSRTAFVAVVGAALLGMVGCVAPAAMISGVSDGTALSGLVHGGQQPVVGATISLVAPGITGYGSAGTVFATAVTNGSGGFTLPAYSCPANSGLVYLLATGGNAGGGANPSIAEAAILGPCSGLTPTTFVNITEVTTVAAAYALAPFANVTTGGATIGTSATNLQGLNNAAGAAGNLANVSTGFAHLTGDFPGIVPPTAEINSLADIIAACVNQGSSGGNGTCNTLFTAATPAGGTAPTDTFSAMLNIAQHPGNNTGTLFGLSSANGPFQPTLTSTPPDFSVALGFNGGAITLGGGTVGIGIDASGNAWVSTGLNTPSVHTLTEISPAGVYLSGATVAATTGFGSTVLTNGIGLAIDQNGAVFVDNNGSGNVIKFNSNGTVQATITAASFNGPNAVAIDAGGNPWIANFGGNKVTKITTAGVEAANSPFTAGTGGVDIAVGPLAVWETDYQTKVLSRIDLTTFAVTNVPFGLSGGGVAIDHANNVWVAATGDGNVHEFSDSGTMISPAGGYVAPNGVVQNIVIDGLGNAFAGAFSNTPSTTMGSLFEFSNSGTLLSPASGFSASNVIPVVPQAPGGIDIDGSGNVWIAGTTNGSNLPSYVTEVIGIAAPVVTPRSVATASKMLGVRP